MSGALLARLAGADHIVFLATLCLYCLFGAGFLGTLVQYARLHGRGAEREARLMAAPLPPAEALPSILIQLPTFNEGALIGRICRAIGRFDWPRERISVQILDDSTDGGHTHSERAAEALREAGIDAAVERRPDRRGFKAGALAAGLRLTSQPFVAIFDTDYTPRPDFLACCMRPLIAEPGLAFVQARCDFLNGEENDLTRAQQRVLDAHYAMEQPVRCWSGQILPFNGTCGVWRRAAIEDAGGWSGDTLAEDMDLSFRAQLKGWGALFLAGVAVPGELPNTLEAWRRQQFRWTKGTAEVTRKLVAAVWASRLTLANKLGATLQLGGGVFGLLFGLTLASGVIDCLAHRGLSAGAGLLLAVLLVEVVGGPMLLQVAAQAYLRRAPIGRELVQAPRTMAFQLGVSLANLGGGFEALLGRRSAFERTPKAGSDWLGRA